MVLRALPSSCHHSSSHSPDHRRIAQLRYRQDKQCPELRTVELPDQGTVIAFSHVGGLHHEYRRAASQRHIFRVPQQAASCWSAVPPVVLKVSHPAHKAIYSPLSVSPIPYSLTHLFS